jgi:uncharacterized protein (TIGR00299 family) protein
MRIGYLECFSGISGDMLLGALVDAGVPFQLLDETARSLNVGAHLAERKVMRGGLTGTKIDVIIKDKHAHEAHEHALSHSHDHQHEHTHEHAEHHTHTHTHADKHEHSHEPPHDHEHNHEEKHSHDHHRSLSAILSILQNAPLAKRVKQRSMRAFQLLGEAEAAIHSMPIESVHFHEVGAVDTIIDIVCTAAGVEFLNIDRWLSSPLNVGSGTVVCAHGTLPVPAPATLALLADAPVYADGPAMERVTPTGAAILRMLEVEFAQLPPMRISSRGYGAGGRDTPSQPNLLRLLIGEDTSAASATEQITILETVIDDTNPQVIAYVSEQLLAAGAWDVYRIPVQMKKGRTGVQLTVLCSPEKMLSLRDLIFRETTTIGLHWRTENKIALQREFAEVQTTWGPVKIKIARWPNGSQANATPEYEDCRALALTHSAPLKQVLEQAMQAYAKLTDAKEQL